MNDYWRLLHWPRDARRWGRNGVHSSGPRSEHCALGELWCFVGKGRMDVSTCYVVCKAWRTVSDVTTGGGTASSEAAERTRWREGATEHPLAWNELLPPKFARPAIGDLSGLEDGAWPDWESNTLTTPPSHSPSPVGSTGMDRSMQGLTGPSACSFQPREIPR